MQFLKSLLMAMAAALPLASAMAIDRRSTVTVSLAAAGNAKVRVTLTNTGAQELSLFKWGTMFDSAPVQKVAVLRKNGTPVPFEGIHRNYYLKNLPAEAFLSVAAGKSVDVIVDLAALHDLSTGGAFDVATVGAIPTAKPGSTELSGGAVAFESNVLSIDVHGPTAAKVEKAINLEKRTVVQSGCTTSERSALLNALSNCAYFAKNAASAATSGSATKFSEYYKTTSSTTRSTVAARFQGVASQASTTTSGGTRYSCYDTYGYCSPNVLAYTLPSQNYIANCDLYYTLPAVASSCHEQDRATTSLHEFTHAPATYSPGTQDNAYGYSASTQLSSSAAVLNADTYALYANAIYLGC